MLLPFLIRGISTGHRYFLLPYKFEDPCMADAPRNRHKFVCPSPTWLIEEQVIPLSNLPLPPSLTLSSWCSSADMCQDLGHSLSPLSADKKGQVENTKPGRALVGECEETERPVNSSSGIISKDMDEVDFDPSAPPPFKIADIRAAIPEHCWVKNPWRSLSYVARDLVVVVGLIALALHFDNWMVWPVYWAAQGTMFWAIFVLGHDCGHGSFSNNPTLNGFVGHILHSSILVPYHGWRISHRTHHQNHGNVEKDESWVPLPEKTYKNLDYSTKFMRYKIPFPMFAYPLYLWSRSPGKTGSHFDPYSDLFQPSDRKYVVTSTVCWTLMLVFLVCLSAVFGVMQMLKIYGIPYLVFVFWLDFVTYLHHHGYEQKLPWYRGKEWSYLRGGLTTVDRDYGWFNNIHHDIGTHVIHHLFPQIPHYHLVEATRAAKSVLGKYYREPRKSGPIPFHLIENLVRSISQDHYVSDTGDIVYYQTDPSLNGSHQKSKDQ